MRREIKLSGCLLAFLFLAAPARAADAVNWHASYEQAQALAAQSNRLVLVHFWAPWCDPCRRLDSEVFARPAVGRAIDENYVAVKANVDEQRALAGAFGVSRIPTDVILTPDGRVVKVVESPQTADQYMGLIAQVATAAQAQMAQGLAAASGAPGASAGYPAVAGQATAPSPGGTAQAPAPSTPANGSTAPWNAAASAPLLQGAGVAVGSAAMANNYNMPPGAQAPLGPVAGAVQPQLPMQSPGPAMPPMGAAPAGPVAAQPAPQPRVALDGFCPVHIVNNLGAPELKWVYGNPQLSATHRGDVFYFSTPEARQQFLADPDRFAPVVTGHDPVLALDQRQMVPGTRAFALYYANRMYLFASDATLNAFASNPRHYAAMTANWMAQQAAQPPATMRY